MLSSREIWEGITHSHKMRVLLTGYLSDEFFTSDVIDKTVNLFGSLDNLSESFVEEICRLLKCEQKYALQVLAWAKFFVEQNVELSPEEYYL